MATKRFKSNTGYPVTVWATNPSGNSIEVRVDVEEPYETDDASVIEALQGSPEVREVKGSNKRIDTESGKDAS